MKSNVAAPIDISIVSHRHGGMVLGCLERLQVSLGALAGACRVWVTLNLPEPNLESALARRAWSFEIKLLRNASPLGFGANHNQAFTQSRAAQESTSSADAGRWFLVMNPDIEWPADAQSFWQSLLVQDERTSRVGLLCPTQVDVLGHRQDYTRALLTPWSLALRTLRRVLGLSPSGVAASVESADWVNGACMVLRTQAFASLGGFDERYFMYCEDCDICLRLQLAGWQIRSAPVSVVHDAQRATGRRLRHLAWHLGSLVKMWVSAAFWRFILRPRSRQTRA